MNIFRNRKKVIYYIRYFEKNSKEPTKFYDGFFYKKENALKVLNRMGPGWILIKG